MFNKINNLIKDAVNELEDFNNNKDNDSIIDDNDHYKCNKDKDVIVEDNDHYKCNKNKDSIIEDNHSKLSKSQAHLKKQFKENITDYFLWNENEFILSEYQIKFKEKKDKKIIKKMKEAIEGDIFSIKKSARILTVMDIKIFKKVEPMELIEYNGYVKDDIKNDTKNDTKNNLLLIKLKNKKLSQLTSSFIKKDKNQFNFFYMLIKQLKKYKNYNSINSILLGIKSNKLNNTQLRKINKITKELQNINYIEYYKERNKNDRNNRNDNKNSKNDNVNKNHNDNKNDNSLTTNNYIFIPPIEIILNDIIASNRNENNKIASKRFYFLVEFFIQLQHQEFKYKNNKLEFLWLYQMYNTDANINIDDKKEIKDLYLLL
ncbi:hypothetical protein SLOPH_1742 [Spraguea lophii 42_110]|uniref:Ras-GEF domain-containing protein n=1 Tax=Spraguea lophii (strain 42_110) TaxID=1358809 RepID=S7XII8_SPRLO|nr:hypothetical protein SLOPH_1742 [Spraguea lophii 42_110]